MAFLSKVALSGEADPSALITGLENQYPELKLRRSEKGLECWLENISLVATMVSPDAQGLLISTPFLPSPEDLQLHADLITLIQEDDPEAIFSSSEGVVIPYPDEHYTEERMELWFLAETEKFFQLIRNDEDFLIPFLYRPFHAGAFTRKYWWQKFKSNKESATDLLLHTLRTLQYPGMPEAPTFKVNQGENAVKMVVFDNRSNLLLPPCPRIGFFNSTKKDLVTIPGAQLRHIIPKSWSMPDEHFCLATVLDEMEFNILITRAAALSE